jgi:hypothetical protein
VLLRPQYADVAYERHIVLMRTTLSASKLIVAGRLIGGASDPAWTAYIEDLTRASREQPG